MRRYVSEYRVSSIQNGLSAAVFGVLLTAQLSAFLLYHHPRSEWLWFLSVKLNRISDPALQFYGDYLPVGPLLSCALLALLYAAPLFAQARRSWLGASLLGHLALLICVSSAAGRLEEASAHYDYASLDGLLSAATLNWSTMAVMAAAAALLIVCPLNHFLYMKATSAQPKQNAHRQAGKCVCSHSVTVCYLTRIFRRAAHFLAARNARPAALALSSAKS